ncbi:hypothetical protein D5b_00153 [Faustovirus]|nr:hypothetical protein D5b_00153 [Faustovirus]AMN84758.1 hypothetical protein D6_00358 [Faustovirus]AMP44110.1 hypothetical protein PRJ_Dakar_00151 [Faustovirus]QKE50444.1 hypothetical protein F-VV10_0324 [Faustovirus]
MNVVVIGIIVVLVLLAAAYYYWYTSQNTKWGAYKDIQAGGQFVVLRKVSGNIECAGTDGKTCLRFPTEPLANAAAVTYNAANSAGLKPLACGDAHKAIYGNTGYDQGANHWCNVKF